MWLMLQQEKPQDYVVATGAPIALEDFVRVAFECAGLHWKDHVVQDEKLFRPSDATVSFGDPGKAFKGLGWKASVKGAEVVKKMYQSI
jgi:GDPmannose 4,6-dehydratase